MSDLVGNPEDPFSQNEAQLLIGEMQSKKCNLSKMSRVMTKLNFNIMCLCFRYIDRAILLILKPYSTSITVQPVRVGHALHDSAGEQCGSVVERWTPERKVWGSKPTSAVLCPSARHFTPRKYW